MANFFYTVIIYPLVQIIEFAFMVFYSVFKVPGISVIGVSLAVSFLCLPLYIVAERWQQRERDTEKSLQPGIDRIKAVFKGDEQYMILSTYYKENHYHPMMALRSSFGLLIQIPFFIAAYNYLSTLSILKGQSFLFIHDMGTEDALFHIGSFPINVLPIAMTIINCIAGAIYTKGFKVKDKIQIYGMALLFLILLYKSPAGLVLYWTMNNLFSLIKNVFYKIKNPLKVLYIILCVCIFGIDYYLLFVHNGFMSKRIILAAVCTIFFFTPLFVKAVNNLLSGKLQPLVQNKKGRTALFVITCFALAMLTGFVIPSFIINSSVIEFSNIDGYGNPLSFLQNCLLQNIGLFVLWPLCIYFLFHDRIQSVLTVIFTFMLFAGLVDAFCFSGNYGSLSRMLVFSNNILTPPSQIFINLSVLIILFGLLLFILIKWNSKIMSSLTIVVLFAEIAICGIHGYQITKSYTNINANTMAEAKSITPVYHLSKQGKNVVVFMLDRAEAAYVKPIFDTYPDLAEAFDGFTFYTNTLSYNGHTLMGAPPLYGGYEYTPVEMNKRDTEKLIDKNNEALLLMPRIFSESAGYSAVVSDLSWANYRWIPDMTICDSYDIKGYNIERKYTSMWMSEHPDVVPKNVTSNTIKRNLSWFSIFKEVPLILRDSIYDDGNWCASNNNFADMQEFIDSYAQLEYLEKLTDFNPAKDNTFTCIMNETTHSDQELQAPDFTLVTKVTDKGPCAIANSQGYCGNVTVYKHLASWFDYLKKNGCYDNTRIILVSDHGIGTPEGQNLSFDSSWNLSFNPDHYHPILMVKDFNNNGAFAYDSRFMTNAEVPSLAFKDIVTDPLNPFTKKPITSRADDKAMGISLSDNWQPNSNSAYSFTINNSEWYSVYTDMTKPENWKKGK
jgi:YidC/Oxa1 family membrane protein insertase